MRVGNLSGFTITVVTYLAYVPQETFDTWNNCWICGLFICMHTTKHNRIYNFLSDAFFVWDMLQHMCTWLLRCTHFGICAESPTLVYNKQFCCLSYSMKGIGNMLLWSLENRDATVHTYFDHSKCEDFTWPLQLIFPASTFCFSVPVALQLWQVWIESVLLEDPC